jgi:hypothetical protein
MRFSFFEVRSERGLRYFSPLVNSLLPFSSRFLSLPLAHTSLFFLLL